MKARNSFGPLAAVSAVAILLSGCVLPPIVTAASIAADAFSLGSTGKTVTDHGISLVMDQDCAMLRVFGGEVCRDFPPSEDTPEGALVALAALSDPTVNPLGTDAMVVPHSLAYLEKALVGAVASAPELAREIPAVAFAAIGGERTANAQAAFAEGFAYLAASIDHHTRPQPAPAS